ncbi:tyrosine-type recombinase/integrase [Colwellia sp. BRX8-4]|uniref:integrase domain-containing protein n=1 Tax=Colwellia sp. BRX8-4 TaxID=2759836 RepID=UPI0015F76C59|nr:integrase domain-containing protein [Colwellia sp. BRX8-4]MBA6362318.1 tyrosine-type recombinase/integrase [Colwellia sp. BRX8-8]MBA6372495.1 tyrosine-type recombinase/integrase [Colwellia sp. BRX8-4]
MARITRPLTNTEVDKAKPQAKVSSLFDGEGLELKINPSGTKKWIFKYYKPFTKKRTNLTLGVYPDISLADARKLRAKSKELLAKDIDPKDHKNKVSLQQKERLENTLVSVATRWFEIKRGEVTPDYATDIWRSLELHVLPSLGKYPISEITAPIAIKAVTPIAEKGTLETVKRLNQRLNEIMNYAVNTGLIYSNPLIGIKAAFEKPKKQNMPSIKPNELPNLMQSLSVASIKIVTRYLIEWQLHTMVRPGEAVKARWSEIDFDNQLWNIPAETMKKKRPHSVPLSEQVLNLLESIKPISGHREFIFPADRDPRSHANESTANAAIKRMGYKGKLVAHGLRSLASTTLNEQGFDGDVIEAALAHVDDNEVRRAYNRADYLKRRATMMTWWSEHIENSATGNFSLSSSIRGLRAVNS